MLGHLMVNPAASTIEQPNSYRNGGTRSWTHPLLRGNDTSVAGSSNLQLMGWCKEHWEIRINNTPHIKIPDEKNNNPWQKYLNLEINQTDDRFSLYIPRIQKSKHESIAIAHVHPSATTCCLITWAWGVHHGCFLALTVVFTIPANQRDDHRALDPR